MDALQNPAAPAGATLPQDDPDSAVRQRALRAARRHYRYNHTDLPGVAMLEELPIQEAPSFEWLSMVGRELLDILWNQHLVEREVRRRHWLQWYRYSLGENVSFFFREATGYARQVLPGLLAGAAEQDADAKHRKLRSLLSTWRPEALESVEDIVSAFSGIAPLLVLDQPSGPARSIKDFEQLFQSIQLPEVARVFRDDRTFAWLRLAGPNPTVLRRAAVGWGEDFPFDDARFRRVPGFESDSLAAAFDQGRLFTVAYPELEGLQPSSFPAGRKFVTCPRALFALPAADSIGLPMPVAIRCEPGEGRVYTPRDGWAWQMAKTVVQVADSNHHELIAHLSHTHLLVEAFVIATHRQLAPGHPLFQLLTPHFEGTAFINWAAQEFLVAKGNFVDQLLAGTIESSRGVAAGALRSLSFNASMLPARLADRGVDGAELRFPYRDDALQLWHALHDWVAAYVGLYYDSDGSVAEDRELQAWAREIVSAKGGGLTDFGQSRGGAIRTRDYLVDALTQLIFTASVQHAAVNFPQRNIMSFAPAAPLSAYAPPPRSRRHSEKDWLGQFAPLQMANQQLMILDLLGSVYHGRLGEYGQGHFADPRVLQSLQVLRVRLKEIEGEIRARNARDTEAGLLPYETLLPTAIPQSINI